MRILIISYYFAPQNAIGAVRPTKLAKYLSRLGHEVTVICGPGLKERRDPTLERDLRELADVRVVFEWNPLRRPRPKASAPGPAASAPSVPRTGWKHALADAAYRWLRWQADGSFRRRALKALHALQGPYDVVFSSYAPLSVHEVARQAKRRGLARRWVADFRDELNLPFFWQKRKQARCLRWIRREADVLCAASQGVLDMMGFSDVGRVLTNGFDPEDLPLAQAAQPKDSAFRLAYCGGLYAWRTDSASRDLTPAFRALAALIKRGVLARESVRLAYAGGESAAFRRQAAACGLEELVEDHGMVPRNASLALQREADVLLMASWNLSGQQGILTGKLFEYLMANRPILCCISGDQALSAVREVLEETGAGFCYEQAAANEKELLDWLEALVARWRAGQVLTPQRRERAVEAYAYPSLAKTLEGWLAKL